MGDIKIPKECSDHGFQPKIQLFPTFTTANELEQKVNRCVAAMNRDNPGQVWGAIEQSNAFAEVPVSDSIMIKPLDKCALNLPLPTYTDGTEADKETYARACAEGLYHMTGKSYPVERIVNTRWNRDAWASDDFKVGEGK